MPTLTRWFLKAALIYLILTLCAGILLALPGQPLIPGLFPTYIHILAFGWLTQLIFGVALWMFPNTAAQTTRSRMAGMGDVHFVKNTGLILRIIFEPLHSRTPSILSSWMLVVAALLQWLAGMAFVANTWTRVREK